MTPIQLQAHVRREIDELKTRSASDPVICPICMSDLFDGLKFDQQAAIDASLGDLAVDHVVKMSRCANHFFHMSCLVSQLGSQSFLTCSACKNTYGCMTGDMPPGRMAWCKKSFTCDGTPAGTPTWEITYRFPDGINPTNQV